MGGSTVDAEDQLGRRLADGEESALEECSTRFGPTVLTKRLPWRSLFAQGQRPRLVPVTCGGDFDSRTRHDTDNVVVVATPIMAS